jgi:NAD(P)-dependent dehydrogenase (short-subunit alcohol dehydrogenase family)
MPTVLITGANRGIGLAFARSFIADGWRVHACCRHPDKAQELRSAAESANAGVGVHRLDVTDGLKVASLARELMDEPIDVLINNAGVMGPRGASLGKTDYDEWLPVFGVNVLGPMRMAERFVEHVAASERKLIINISSRMGSIADNTSGGSYIYRSSKAALNMVSKSLANDLADRGITVVAFHPGWVRTDMGGRNAAITPTESVEGMRDVISRLTPADSGKFLSFDGRELPW